MDAFNAPPLVVTRQRGGVAQSLIPSTTLGDWANTNSVLSAVSVSGKTVSLTMANPAASRDLPTTGASYVFPVRNLLGQTVTDLDSASLHELLFSFAAGTSVPADCWVGLVFLNASTVAAATAGIGICIQGNGTGIRGSRLHYVAGWAVAGAATHSASARYACWRAAPLSTSTTLLRGVSASVYDSGGLFLTGPTGGDATNNYTGFPAAYVALCCGWSAGTGVAGSVISVAPSIFAAKPSLIPGVS